MSPSTRPRSRGIAIVAAIYWVLAILPLVIVAVAFPSAPETVAIHFDLRMQPDGWGPRWQLFQSVPAPPGSPALRHQPKGAPWLDPF